jgi:hypothetical protein
MTTEWRFRLYLFVRAVDATAANKRTVAEYFANNGSGETVASELEMFDNVVRLSTTGDPPAQAFGINTPVKLAMREAIVGFMSQLTSPRWAAVANTDLENWQEYELIATNFDVTPNGQIVSWQAALDYLENEFGLIVIPDEPL